jgi:tetratricopeptide (TPR) repeat protein
MTLDERVMQILESWEERRERGVVLSPEELCTECPELVEKVREAIRAVRAFDPEAVANTETVTEAKSAVTRFEIPGYEIVDELGRGGMGVVYKARDLRLNRLVALKVMRAGAYASETELARFQAEAEAVAALQHPNIVQIFDIGRHGQVPYFSLELVEGGTLAAKVHETPLPAREAARMMGEVARAVAYAHSKGVIHRDLKPQNVLLTSGSTPKIVDFGVAKRLDSAAALTQTEAVLGTPSYMAPEQADNSRLAGPAADVYALGAILYRVVTGRPPFQAASTFETLRQVANEEPASPTKLNPQIPRDLETICLKCLRKEPAQRYAGAGDLADDLRRFLDGDTIVARPVSLAERGGRWCRRNPAVAGLGTALAVALVGGFIGMALLWRSALHDKKRAEQSESYALRQEEIAKERELFAKQKAQELENVTAIALAEADKAKRVSEFLGGIFDASDPLGVMAAANYIPKDIGQHVTAVEILGHGAKRIREDKSLSDETRAHLQDRIGYALCIHGSLKEGMPLLQEALETRKRVLPWGHPELATSMHNCGWMLHLHGDFAGSEKMLRDALAMRETAGRERNPNVSESDVTWTMFQLAWLLADGQRLDEAEQLFRKVINMRVKIHGEEHREVAIARFGLAGTLLEKGEDVAATSETGRAIGILKKTHAGDNLGQIVGLFQEGVEASRVWRNHTAGANKLEEGIRVLKTTLHDDHPYLALFYGQLGDTYAAAKRDDLAEEAFRKCFEIIHKYNCMDFPRVTLAVSFYAPVLCRRNESGKAEELFHELISTQERKFGREHFFVADARVEYSVLLRQLNKPEREAEELDKALAIYRKNNNPPRRGFFRCLNNTALRLMRNGQPAAAEALLQECLEAATKRTRAHSDDVGLIRCHLARALLAQNRTDAEVESLLLRPKSNLFEYVSDSPAPPQVHFCLGWLYRLRGQPDKAISELRTCRREMKEQPKDLVEVAREFMRLVAKLEPTRRAECENEAVATLKLAVKHGLKERKSLQEDEIFSPLRARADFQELTR